MDRMELYRDIAKRTQGDIYIGVVGPVRTGKSTFIKRFLDLLVLTGIENEHVRARLVDEMPQSAAGRTIMTTQPKFIPNEAVELKLPSQAAFKVRLVDCVGYLIRGVLGTQDGEGQRMVRTPWFDHDIPFEEAAEIAFELGQISASMLQRRLKVGYARAGRLLDILDKKKVISTYDGSNKPRQLIMSRQEFNEMLEKEAMQ